MHPRSIRVIAIVLGLITGCAALLGWDLAFEQNVTESFIQRSGFDDDLTRWFARAPSRVTNPAGNPLNQRESKCYIASETFALQSVHTRVPASRILNVLWREFWASKKEKRPG
jgi:hypothetical protein